MDWGIDPERVAELAAIAEARRFSARESEAFILAVTGGGAHADMPLWDLLTILFGLGHLTASRRMGPRDAAIGALLDQSEMPWRALRREAAPSLTAAGARISAGPAGLTVAFAGVPALRLVGTDDGGPQPTRDYSWSRVRMCLAIGDFLFMSAAPRPGQPDGLSALSMGLDAVFGAARFDEALLKRAIQEPARFMRVWRKQHLPLQAYAELVRLREAWFAEQGRTRVNRDLAADDVLALWQATREGGATWPYARFLEKLACLTREERMGAGRRSFMDAAPIDDVHGADWAHNPEDALLEWLDLARDAVGQGHATPGEHAPPEAPADAERDEDGSPYDAERDGPELAEERSVLALAQLPDQPKMLTGEQRAGVAAVLGLLPLAAELPLALLRAQASREWENRLIEQRRRGAERAAVDTAPPPFAYFDEVAALAAHRDRLAQLVAIGVVLGAPGPAGLDLTAADAALKKLQRDRASFRMEAAELALIFTRAQGALLTVSRALGRITKPAEALATKTDLGAAGRRDRELFITILTSGLPEKA
jgi:hypothetical protein